MSASEHLTFILNTKHARAVAGLRSVSDQVGQLGSRLSGLTRFAGTAMGIGGGVGIAGGAVYATKKIVELGVRMEQTRLSFQTMMRDVSKGNAVLGQLNQFSNITPFLNSEVISSGKTLLAFGVEARKLQGILKMVGDTSAGTGKDFVELSQIVGKSIAKGKADSETLNQLSEAGVPIVKTLGAMYNKTGQEVYKMAENGQLTSDIIIAAFRKMTSEGGIFEDMMSKQAETTGGKWSTVVGKLQLTASTIGEAVNPMLQTGLQYLMGWVDELDAMTKDGRAIEYLSTIGMTGVIAAGELIKWFNRFYEYGSAAFTTLQRVVQVQFEAIQFIVTDVFVKIIDRFISFVNAAIEVANKTPGIDIKLVERPEFVDQIAQWAKLSKDQMKEEWSAVMNGKDFTDAAGRIAEKDKSLDETVNNLNNKIGNWQSKQQEEIVRRQLDAKKFAAEMAGDDKDAAIPDIAAGKVPKTRQLKVDSLTKMGLYNFGAAVPSVDMERNKLLRDIKTVLENPRMIPKLI